MPASENSVLPVLARFNGEDGGDGRLRDAIRLELLADITCSLGATASCGFPVIRD
jgi:hypothetical protein